MTRMHRRRSDAEKLIRGKGADIKLDLCRPTLQHHLRSIGGQQVCRYPDDSSQSVDQTPTFWLLGSFGGYVP